MLVFTSSLTLFSLRPLRQCIAAGPRSILISVQFIVRILHCSIWQIPLHAHHSGCTWCSWSLFDDREWPLPNNSFKLTKSIAVEPQKYQRGRVLADNGSWRRRASAFFRYISRLTGPQGFGGLITVTLVALIAAVKPEDMAAATGISCEPTISLIRPIADKSDR